MNEFKEGLGGLNGGLSKHYALLNLVTKLRELCRELTMMKLYERIIAHMFEAIDLMPLLIHYYTDQIDGTSLTGLGFL